MIFRNHVELDDAAQAAEPTAINRVITEVWGKIIPVLQPDEPIKVNFAVANWPIVWLDGTTTEYISVAAEVGTQ